jgi:hypothetical protein
MMNPDGDFSKNNIDIYYYRDPSFKTTSTQFAFSNEEKPVIIETEFYWGNGNNYELFRERAKLSCRFTSTSDATKVIVTPAVMETRPIGAFQSTDKPNQIRCRTPKWGTTDTANVEVSVNGHDYLGSFQYQFVGDLQIYKISPLAGPIGGSTKVKLYGTGLGGGTAKEAPVYVKFGVVAA